MASDGFYVRRKECRLCSSKDIVPVVSLKPSALAEWYLPADLAWRAEQKYPLDLFLCRECCHVQLVDVINADDLFSNYMYESKTSPGLIEYFRQYATHATSKLGLQSGARILDIGSNDGTLLNEFKKLGMEVRGIDPAKGIADAATTAGIPTLNSFMNAEAASGLVGEGGPFTLCTANNVFAHNDSLGEMVDAIRSVLADDGVFVFEVSYLLDTVQDLVFDFIYHEHLCYHSVRPMERFLASHGLELFDVERTRSKGGTLRGFAQVMGGPRRIQNSVGELRALEQDAKLCSPETYLAFVKRVDNLGEKLSCFLSDETSRGRRVWGYGASATVTTLLHHFDIGGQFECLVDDNPMRHGTVSPGFKIPVVSPDEIRSRRPDVIVVLAWRFAEQIIARNTEFVRNGGTFVVPCPEFRVLHSV